MLTVPINPAYRLHNIIAQASGLQKDSQSSMVVWQELFMLTEIPLPEREFQVTEGLKLLYQELNLTRALMATTSIPESNYKPALDAVQNALQIGHLAQNWNSVRSQLGPQHVISISWCSQILPSEETLIDAQELADLLKDLDELEKEIENLADPFKSLVIRHIHAIRAALKWYPITGRKGLEATIHRAYGEIQTNPATFASEENPETKKKVARVWAKFMLIAKKAEGAVSTIHKLIEMSEKARQIYESFEVFISGNSGGPPSLPPPPSDII